MFAGWARTQSPEDKAKEATFKRKAYMERASALGLLLALLQSGKLDPNVRAEIGLKLATVVDGPAAMERADLQRPSALSWVCRDRNLCAYVVPRLLNSPFGFSHLSVHTVPWRARLSALYMAVEKLYERKFSNEDCGDPQPIVFLHKGDRAWWQRAVALAAADAPAAAERSLRCALALCSLPGCYANSQSDGKPLLKCSACQSVTYCCASCQLADWKPQHKVQCKALGAQRTAVE